jgi:hypothetical protein
MPEISEPRVAVYLDFDNIVISRYDQVHGRGHFMRDRGRFADAARGADPEISLKLSLATVDIGAIIDFAASFGTLVLTRAYADWSAPVNADYRQQLVARAIDLVQLFPAAAYAKNGADIRLAVDAVEDMFRLPDLTHVVIVAGDSDYIALAQRCKRLGRYVVGVGVAGSTSKALAAACDEFDIYDSLPGVPALDRAQVRASIEAMNAFMAGGPGEPDAGATTGSDAAPGSAAAPAAGAGKRAGSDGGSGTEAEAGPGAATADEAQAKKGARKTAGKGAAQKSGAKKSATPEASAQAIDARTATEASLASALDAVAGGTSGARGAASTGLAGESAAGAPGANGPSGDTAADDPTAGSASTSGTGKRAPRRASTAMIIAPYEPEHDEDDDDADDEHTEDPQDAATKLLERALELGHGKDDADWLHSSAVKQHMKRMDPSFSEKALGFRTFSDFVKARESIAELEETGHERLVRLKQH